MLWTETLCLALKNPRSTIRLFIDSLSFPPLSYTMINMQVVSSPQMARAMPADPSPHRQDRLVHSLSLCGLTKSKRRAISTQNRENWANTMSRVCQDGFCTLKHLIFQNLSKLKVEMSVFTLCVKILFLQPSTIWLQIKHAQVTVRFTGWPSRDFQAGQLGCTWNRCWEY